MSQTTINPYVFFICTPKFKGLPVSSISDIGVVHIHTQTTTVEFGVPGLLKWTCMISLVFNGVFLSSVVIKRNVHSYRFISFIALLRSSTHSNTICHSVQLCLLQGVSLLHLIIILSICKTTKQTYFLQRLTPLIDLKSGRCSSTVEIKLLRFWEEVKRGGELIPIQQV